MTVEAIDYKQARVKLWAWLSPERGEKYEDNPPPTIEEVLVLKFEDFFAWDCDLRTAEYRTLPAIVEKREAATQEYMAYAHEHMARKAHGEKLSKAALSGAPELTELLGLKKPTDPTFKRRV